MTVEPRLRQRGCKTAALTCGPFGRRVFRRGQPASGSLSTRITSRLSSFNSPRQSRTRSPMSDFVVLGTDTDSGKTTFSLLWLTAFCGEFAYWKPVETGESATDCGRRLLPGTQVIDVVVRLP